MVWDRFTKKATGYTIRLHRLLISPLGLGPMTPQRIYGEALLARGSVRPHPKPLLPHLRERTGARRRAWRLSAGARRGATHRFDPFGRKTARRAWTTVRHRVA